MEPKYMIRFQGSFYSSELYDRRGRTVHNLRDAVDAANDIYGDSWTEVYNGHDGALREEQAPAAASAPLSEEQAAGLAYRLGGGIPDVD